MPSLQNISNLIERKQYIQTLRNLKNQNIIKVITGEEKKKMFIDTGDNKELASVGDEDVFSQFYYYTVGYYKAAN
jgi:hypothetical protein